MYVRQMLWMWKTNQGVRNMSKEAMKQWLEALEHMCNHTRAKVGYKAKIVGGAMDSLRQAIAEAEMQEQDELYLQ